MLVQITGVFSWAQSLAHKDGILPFRFQQFVVAFQQAAQDREWGWQENLLRDLWHLSAPEREWKDASLRGREKPTEAFSLPQGEVGNLEEREATPQ